MNALNMLARWLRCTGLLAVAALTFAIRAEAALVGDAILNITSVGNAGGGGVNKNIGFNFTATSDSVVTALGVFDYQSNGFQEAHSVGLWDSSGTLIASTSFAAGVTGEIGPGYSPGYDFFNSAFRYLNIAPVALSAGSTYTAGAFFPSPQADSTATNFTYTATGTLNTFLYDPFVSAFARPTSPTLGQFAAVNLLTSPVPLPAAAWLLISGASALGALGWRRRRQLS